MKALRTISANKGLSRLLIAQIPADFADWLDYVAIGALLAFTWGAGPMAFAWLAAAMGSPYLLVGIFAGTVVDKSDLRTILVLSNLARALTTFALFFAGTAPVLLAIVFLRSSADAFFTPAKQASIQALTPSADLMQVNGISHMISQTSKIAGPMAGGLLLLILVPQQVFLLNGVISLSAAAILIGLPHGFRPVQKRPKSSMFSDIREAFAVVRKNQTLLFGITLMGAGFFSMFFYDTMFPLLTAAFSFDETTLGLAIASVGVGGTIGAAIITTITPRQPFGTIGFGSIISGLGIFTLGILASINTTLDQMLFLTIFLLIGFSAAAVFVPFKTIMQQHSDPEIIGRITSLSEAINVTAMLTAPFIGATIAAAFSIGISFATGGVMQMTLGIFAILISMKITTAASP